MEQDAEIDRLPIDLLAHILMMITSFTDLAQASGVCRKWKQGVKEALARRKTLSFAGYKMDDDSTARLVRHAYSLKELDMDYRQRCRPIDESLSAIADSCPRLKSIVLWSCRHVTEKGLIVLVSKCRKLESINVWGTRVPLDCFIGLLTIRPALQIKPRGLPLNVMLPVV
ncbi:hypothetical protein V6N13_043977 [Hibiscus sabdariffa]